MIDRLVSRLLHLTGRRAMSDAYSEVNLAGTERGNDEGRVQELESFLDRARRPFSCSSDRFRLIRKASRLIR